jgi:hypothetical protein
MVKIFRFDPTADKESRYESYEVPQDYWCGVNVIDTIRYIYLKLNKLVAFFKELHGRRRKWQVLFRQMSLSLEEVEPQRELLLKLG